MNIVELFLLGAVVQMQEKILSKEVNGKYLTPNQLSLIDLSDEIISDLGFEPEDWEDDITLSSPSNLHHHYIHISHEALN